MSVKPREEVAPLFAVKPLQSGGPDRGWELSIAQIQGIAIEAVEDLLAPALFRDRGYGATSRFPLAAPGIPAASWKPCFQIYRVGEYYHWDIDGIEYVVPLFWNAVGNRADAGIETYNSRCDNQLRHARRD